MLADNATRSKRQVKATQLHKLTALQVDRALQGKHGDGGGLWLDVGSTGSRKWVFRYRFDGRQREMGLGAAGKGAVTLKGARETAAWCRDVLADGGDPIAKRTSDQQAVIEAKRAQSAIPTFGELAAEYIEINSPSWKNEKHIAQWSSTLATYAKPINMKPVDAITPDDILACLKPIWRTKSETASRVRGRIEAVMGLAIARRLRPGPNPAAWKDNLAPQLGGAAKGRGVTHQPALDWRQLPAFITALREIQDNSLSAICLVFAILTASRSGEVRGATWGEIDMDADGGPVWSVPAERMKASKPHEVPLSPQAVMILERVKPLTGGLPDAHIFPAPRSQRGATRPLSDMSLSAVMRRMHAAEVKAGREGWLDPVSERPAVPHGTARSGFRDWCGETGAAPREVAEAALAHRNGDATERAYARGSMLQRRRALMVAWADWCEGQGASDGKVLAFTVRKETA